MYGKVDNLHISYDGNRMTGVLEDAAPVTQNGSMDHPGENKWTDFGYNDWGYLFCRNDTVNNVDPTDQGELIKSRKITL